VPEAALTPANAKYLYQVVARGGIGFSPFGIDDNGKRATTADSTDRLAPFGQEYELMGPMMRELAEWGIEGKIKAVMEREDHAEQTIDLGAWQAVVSFGSGGPGDSMRSNAHPNGKELLIQLDENTFLVMGTLSHITFRPAGNNAGRAWQYLKVEEGRYENGAFKILRILNGDETDWGGPRFGAAPTLLKISLIAR
jgi:hypothetical protein